jgi:hypothetical protein
VGDGCRAAARVTGGAADQACVAPAWATARGATVAQTTMGGAAARTCATAAPAMTDGAVARATTGREVTKVSTVWRCRPGLYSRWIFPLRLPDNCSIRDR